MKEPTLKETYIQVLIKDYGYPPSSIVTEEVIAMGSSGKRADIVIKNEKGNIIGIVETKQPTLQTGREQLESYMRAMATAEWCVWTNGPEEKHGYKDKDTLEIKFPSSFSIPTYGKTVQTALAKRIRCYEQLRPAHNLRFIFKKIQGALYANTNLARTEKQGAEMIRLLFCKIHDELENKEDLQFQTYVGEDEEVLKARIDSLWQALSKGWIAHDVFSFKESVVLDSQSLIYVVKELQDYGLMKTDRDVIGDAFEVFAEKQFAGEKGQFFTPRGVVKLAVGILDPKENETILDPACGSGGFLIYALDHMTKGCSLEKKKALASQNLYGIDKDEDLVKIAKAYMCLMGDGKTNIQQADSLKPRKRWEKGIDKFWDKKERKKFDVILTNPPFGTNSALAIKEKEVLAQYALAHKKAGAVVSPTPPQILFLDLCVNKLLKEGGRMAIVLPDGMLGNPTYSYIREHVLDRCRLVAVIDLHQLAFMPFTGNKCSLVVLEKGRKKSSRVFFAIAENVGHTSRGMPTNKEDFSAIYENYKKGNTSSHLGFWLNTKDLKNNIWCAKYYDPRIGLRLSSLQRHNTSTHSLASLAELVQEKVIDIKTITKYPKAEEYAMHGEYRYIRTADVYNLELSLVTDKRVDKDIYEAYCKKQNLQVGDILFVKDGGIRIGNCVLLTQADLNIVVQGHFYVIRSLTTDPYCILYALNSPFFKAQLIPRVFSQGTLSSITKDRLLEIELEIPLEHDEGVKKMKLLLQRRLGALNDLTQQRQICTTPSTFS